MDRSDAVTISKDSRQNEGILDATEASEPQTTSGSDAVFKHSLSMEVTELSLPAQVILLNFKCYVMLLQ
ncbi:hypothetical protein H920_12259 [Fukomys damarensis]|uniref:Uncharacterized protein n=1 Tax=Fukomys damarensis TaxID=885580 RepID=A0A091D2K9_FUKDA|nr:hypothetical protein H920_12259 [Fukomys damarensis]